MSTRGGQSATARARPNSQRGLRPAGRAAASPEATARGLERRAARQEAQGRAHEAIYATTRDRYVQRTPEQRRAEERDFRARGEEARARKSLETMRGLAQAHMLEHPDRALAEAQQRLRSAEDARQRTLRARVRLGDPYASEDMMRRFQGEADRLYAAADKARGGSGALVSYYNEASRTAVRSVFGREVSRGDLARLVGAQEGDHVTIEARPTKGRERPIFSVSFDSATRSGEHNFTRGRDGVEIHDSSVTNERNRRTALSGREALRAFAHMQRMGISRIVATASRHNGANGYYTWARLGFTGKIPASVLPAAQARFGKVTTVQALMKQPGGPAWWREHGDSWHATFSFKPGSHSRRVFDALVARGGLAA